MDRLGEIERSKENRTDGTGGDFPFMLTRVGEVERVKKVVDLEEKLELEEAKFEEEE